MTMLPVDIIDTGLYNSNIFCNTEWFNINTQKKELKLTLCLGFRSVPGLGGECWRDCRYSCSVWDVCDVSVYCDRRQTLQKM